MAGLLSANDDKYIYLTAILFVNESRNRPKCQQNQKDVFRLTVERRGCQLFLSSVKANRGWMSVAG
ncbi:hypothetical protein KUV73_17720 [Mameliella alba]|nr:hypothetical protein [Mameliella alba]MBY6170993.1 hypothetical protein [Mameliella alba]MBY6176217.1 hypothetical protein [Mameliella alba]